MINIDYWYGHSFSDIAFVDCTFYDLDTAYRGNIYDKDRKCIGDWTCRDSVEIEKTFPGIFDN